MSKKQSYNKKRNMGETPEPESSQRNRAAGDEPVFVIQKHDASNLHYDFRLEIEGGLKSWTVPKGPSTDPSEKRLAVPTEDHPMEYRDFEGVIPEGQYGSGTVMIWDAGTYENMKTKNDEKVSMNECYENGRIEISLQGEKISGGYALVQMGGGNDDKWLLIKMDDEQADARRNPVSTENKSVKTGRTMDEISKEEQDE
jgi:DNA ligase D-like protein (predicted 3'-phosphoesterase)